MLELPASRAMLATARPSVLHSVTSDECLTKYEWYIEIWNINVRTLTLGKLWKKTLLMMPVPNVGGIKWCCNLSVCPSDSVPFSDFVQFTGGQYAHIIISNTFNLRSHGRIFPHTNAISRRANRFNTCWWENTAPTYCVVSITNVTIIISTL